MLSINLDSAFLCRPAFVPGMKQRGWGRIVNMASSTLGSVVTGFVALHVEQGRHRRLHAGDGERARPARHHSERDRAGTDALAGHACRASRGAGMADMDEEFESVAQMQAIKRVEVPDDLVGTVSYLTSDDAAFITGQTLNVDGGRVRRS